MKLQIPNKSVCVMVQEEIPDTPLQQNGDAEGELYANHREVSENQELKLNMLFLPSNWCLLIPRAIVD